MPPILILLWVPQIGYLVLADSASPLLLEIVNASPWSSCEVGTFVPGHFIQPLQVLFYNIIWVLLWGLPSCPPAWDSLWLHPAKHQHLFQLLLVNSALCLPTVVGANQTWLTKQLIKYMSDQCMSESSGEYPGGRGTGLGIRSGLCSCHFPKPPFPKEQDRGLGS